MKVFDVYKHPAQGYQAVKQGFGWPAFFFTAIWAFVKSMWGVGFALIGAMFLLTFIETVFEQEGSEGGVVVMLFAQLVLYIVVGVKGNDWRCSNLQNRGFEKIRSVQAETPDAAIGDVAKTVVPSGIGMKAQLTPNKRSVEDTKKCPFCAEEIKKEAVVCRFCGRDLPTEALHGSFDRGIVLNIDSFETTGDLIDYAGKNGYSKAKYLLGMLYLKGDLIEKDEGQAVYWLQKAADEDYQEAKDQLSQMIN